MQSYDLPLSTVIHQSTVKVTPELVQDLTGRLKDFNKLDIESAQEISDLLRNHGIRRLLKIHDSGSSAFIAPVSRKKLIVKISNIPIEEKTHPSCELLPLKVIRKSKPSIAIYAGLNTEKVTQDHVNQLIASAHAEGFLFFDAKPSNVGLLSDGTPVIIDADAVVRLEDMDKPFAKSFMPLTYKEQFERKIGKSYEEWQLQSKWHLTVPKEKYEKAIDHHHQNLEIDFTQKGLGILVTDEDINMLNATHTSQLAKTVEELGLDRELLGKFLMEMPEKGDKDQDWETRVQSFVQSISNGRA